MLRPRVVYSDLDGTLLGPGGSLFAAPDGGVSMRAADAVAALHREGLAFVPVSGRAEPRVREAARVLGAQGFIAELGGITVRGEDVVRDLGSFRGRGTPHEAMVRTGAVGLLLEAYAGRLEPHAPWAFDQREVSMLLRGMLDEDEANALLHRAGHQWLRLHDNGIIRRRVSNLDVPEVHIYHLLPAGVDKARAVAADLRDRGIARQDAAAIGDATSDLGLAPAVGEVFLVANGAWAVERAAAVPRNVRVTEGAYGDGFAEAVEALLGR